MIRVNPNGLNVHQNCKYNNNKQNVIKNTPAFGKTPVSTLTHNQKAARIAEELATWVTTENPDSYPTIFCKNFAGIRRANKDFRRQERYRSSLRIYCFASEIQKI